MEDQEKSTNALLERLKVLFIGIPALAAFLLGLPIFLLVLGIWILALLVFPRAPETFATAERIRVWDALSAFYLDTELSELEISSIAEILRDSGFSRKTAWQILETEVGPNCVFNLLSTAGEWEEGALSGPWLKREILKSQPAALFMRRLPGIGFLWARFVTLGVRGKFLEVLDLAYPAPGDDFR